MTYAIMEKTADLRVVQQTVTNTLHREVKTEKNISKETGSVQT